MEFKPLLNVLKCNHCQTEEILDPPEEKPELDTIVEDKKQVECHQCSTRFSAPLLTISCRCPTCDAHLVTKPTLEEKPEYIQNFSVSRKDAQAQFDKWIDDSFEFGKHPPEVNLNDLKKKLRGVYLPFWHFNATVISHYRGEDRYLGWTKSEGYTPMSTSYSGSVKGVFSNMPALGADNISSKLIEDLGEWEFSEVGLKKFNLKKLLGFEAEEFSINPEEAYSSIKNEIEEAMSQYCYEDLEGQGDAGDCIMVVTDIDSTYQDEYYDYVLLPLWIAEFEIKGENYYFAINGSTGKVAKKSYSGNLGWGCLLTLAVAIGGAAYYFLYL